MGAARLWKNRGGDIDDERYAKLLEGRAFFMRFFRSEGKAKRMAIENPGPLSAAALPRPSQVIQPFMFGDPFTKRTCLWLKDLPPLMATDIVQAEGSWMALHRSPTVRSKTFPGIAEAMADQWGVY